MNDIASQIESLLKVRQQGYFEITQTLFKKLEFVTTALIDACREHEDADADRIQWLDIQRNEGTLLIIGVVDMLPGSVVPTQEGLIELTAETASHFKRKIVFNLSIEALERHTPEQVVDIIRQSVMINHANQLNEQPVQPPYINVETGFDLTKLTPEQKLSLTNYIKIQSEKAQLN
ncbi:MAG: hypothetical protein ACREAU_07715 [Nitrosopumilaceae archaeon]